MEKKLPRIKALLTPGEVAKRSGVAVSTLHFYESKGLISSMRNSGNQLHELEYSVNEQLSNNATRINQLAQSIAEANEQVAMFNAMYQEYALNPEVTKTRMYYEAISDILPGIKLYINTGTGSDMQMLLPLETLVGSEGGETK